jgi:glycosyltransferase involved in cell wall biosynthesis
MKVITVFTPTYNRGYCLHQVYESLVKQTSQDFIWMIIDDGSTDNTKDILQSWLDLNRITIKYIYQENQGMHGAHNTAYSNIQTELNVCIDSDDYMPDNGIELILNKWETIEHKEKIAGIVGLDVFKTGVVVGTKLPDNLLYCELHELYYKYKIKGDKKLVLRTALVKEYPQYPIFFGERFVPLGILYLMIDQNYKLACLNEPLCVVEYLPDGSSLNIFKQYKLNPKGFRYSRIIEIKYTKDLKIKILKILHLISSTLFIGDYQFFKNNSANILIFFCLPLGMLFHLYILIKVKL